MKNIRKNKIPLTDNKHAKKMDIIAVFFATLAVTSIISVLISPYFLLIPASSFIMWVTTRFKIILIFAHYGICFFFKATILLFSLELIRALCVMICISSNSHITNKIQSS